VNSDTPSDEYLIPLKLTWNPGPPESTQVVFPAPKFERFSFSEQPISVFSVAFNVIVRFKTTASAAAGPVEITGKISYQACNDRECLVPKDIDLAINVNVVK